MKPFIAFIFVFLFFFSPISAKLNNYYAIKFTDKNHNTFQLNNPEEFLSIKALIRREKQNIRVSETDLPITPGYLYQIKKKGAKLIHTSRWLNTAIVTCPADFLPYIEELYFVEEILFVGKDTGFDNVITDKKKKRKIPKQSLNSVYGKGHKQIDMLNGIDLHDKDKRGKGITIAVLDAGFWRADDIKMLHRVQASYAHSNNRDFVNRDRQVFESSAHGTEVLSVMAADLPGVLVGTAPDASFVCIKTEDIRGEFWLDEYNWVAGLEYADSIGVDLVVSSLGYTTFNDAKMNYNYDDLVKNKAISTRAANIAYTKGMIIVCSAGNEGNNNWKYVSCPADGKGVLAVGAVDISGQKTSFSSLPYEINGLLKPDVSALGQSVYVASVKGKDLTKKARGTSYAAPIIGGLTASLWSAFPDCSNQTILDAIRLSAAENETKGLPDFARAYEILLMKGVLSKA